MPTHDRSKWLGACLLGGAIIVVFGAACLYAASHASPAWMAGRELPIFLKLSAITVVAVAADICWRAVAIRRPDGREAVPGGGDEPLG